MQKSNREFYVLTNSLSPTYGRRGKPWYINVNTTWKDIQNLHFGKALEKSDHLRAEIEDNSRREDFPMTSDASTVVSTKAKEVLEQVAPGNCLFWPIPIFHNGERLPDGYWLANCICYLDRGVIDSKASMPWLIDHSKPRDPPEYVRVELDAAKVPLSARYFLVQGQSTYPFIREEVRLAFVAAKLTGWTAWEG
jgi:hypothetical protein